MSGLDADAVIEAVARLLGAIEYSAQVQIRVGVTDRSAELIGATGADIARAEMALVDLLAGEGYGRWPQVRKALRAAQVDARNRAEAAVAELRAEAGR